MNENEQDRLEAVRRGGRKAERRARHFQTQLRDALEILDNLAEQIETTLNDEAKGTK